MVLYLIVYNFKKKKKSRLPAVSSLQLLAALPMPLFDYLSENIFPGGKEAHPLKTPQ